MDEGWIMDEFLKYRSWWIMDEFWDDGFWDDEFLKCGGWWILDDEFWMMKLFWMMDFGWWILNFGWMDEVLMNEFKEMWMNFWNIEVDEGWMNY